MSTFGFFSDENLTNPISNVKLELGFFEGSPEAWVQTVVFAGVLPGNQVVIPAEGSELFLRVKDSSPETGQPISSISLGLDDLELNENKQQIDLLLDWDGMLEMHPTFTNSIAVWIRWTPTITDNALYIDLYLESDEYLIVDP